MSPLCCLSAFCCNPPPPPPRVCRPLHLPRFCLWLLITSAWLSCYLSPSLHPDITLSRAFHKSLSSELGQGISPYFLVCVCPLAFGHVTGPSPQCSDPSQLWSEGTVVAGTHGRGAVREVRAMRYPETSEREEPLAPSPGGRRPPPSHRPGWSCGWTSRRVAQGATRPALPVCQALTPTQALLSGVDLLIWDDGCVHLCC